MSHLKLSLQLLIFFSILGCSPKTSLPITDDGKIVIQILQLNDVYEIAPLPGDDQGGMARVATLKKELLAKNPNTLCVMAGDFLSPSVIGTLNDRNGHAIKGAQMVDVMNHVVDLVTFGNHEFDLKEEDLQKRIDESTFQWVSSNVRHVVDGAPKAFHKNPNHLRPQSQPIPETHVKTFKDRDGTELRVGFFGVTIDVKKQDYITYSDHTQRTKDMLQVLSPATDLIIPLTHLDISEDVDLAKAVPGFPLIIGGHDHNNMREVVGKSIIAKADANAKTVYVHTITIDKNKSSPSIVSKLTTIDNTIKEDPIVKRKVDKWKQIAWDDMKRQGFDPDHVVTLLEEPLDGRESTVRGGQNPLGAIVAKSMTAATDDSVDGSIVNSGSIRVDDVLKGQLTEYDIVRILPYAGGILVVEMTGTLLKKLLEASTDKINTGAYLQLDKIRTDEPSRTSSTDGTLVRTDRNYTIAMNDFLLEGYDFDFLTKDTEGILRISYPDQSNPNDLRKDLRKAMIAYLSE